MTRPEWESLCDGCGKCCLFKLKGTGEYETLYTKVCCYMLNIETCRCKSYWQRQTTVSTCLVLTPERLEEFLWLPKTCAYRLVSEGKDLPDWHHLVCGDRETIHRLGYSVKAKVISSEFVHPKQLPDFIVDWQ